jgi:O-methyltransferase involved in polyketide biosynthesis
MYLTREATVATLRRVAALAPGSTFVMSFMRTLELMEPEERSLMEWVIKSAREAGTPWVSFYAPDDMLELAREAGFAKAEYVSADALNERYFAGRSDGLRTAAAEELLVATV